MECVVWLRLMAANSGSTASPIGFCFGSARDRHDELLLYVFNI